MSKKMYHFQHITSLKTKGTCNEVEMEQLKRTYGSRIKFTEIEAPRVPNVAKAKKATEKQEKEV